MREILFRGKRISDGAWVEGGINKVFHPNYQHDSYRDFELQKPNCYCICADNKDVFVEQMSIGQYTGLRDRTGKMIYEGDIVHCKSRLDSADMVVIYENGQFRMILSERYNSYQPNMGYYDINCFNKTIIGNIHDNSELLEAEE